MKIAFDCRYIGRSGIGRLCEGILDSLDLDADAFYLIGKRSKLEKYRSAKIVEDDTDPYSFAGLRSFDRSLNRICDAYFTPNFLIPFGIKIPIHAVMHDLAFLDVKETTNGLRDKLIKKILLKRCMNKAKTVACVSEFTKGRCEFYYGKLAKKCYVNYSGVSDNVFAYAKAHPVMEKENKIVFVGNVKPHKGLMLLLDAFSKVTDGTVLKIIGERENFRMAMDIDEEKYPNVEFTGHISDDELFHEIASAKFLVLPSKYEGFGLPPLEALVLGTQPIISDIPVFREVYDGLPVKFYHTKEELAMTMMERTDVLKDDLVEEIHQRYNFGKTSDILLRRMKDLV